MTKNADRSFRIVIDKRIVRAFEDIPETFSIKQLIQVSKKTFEEQKMCIMCWIRMSKYELIKKSRDGTIWHKEPLITKAKKASKFG